MKYKGNATAGRVSTSTASGPVSRYPGRGSSDRVNLQLQSAVATLSHRDTMEALAREQGWKRGVELGLGHGLLFRRFLALGIDMVGVDLGRRPERRAEVEKLGGKVHWMATAQAARLVPDGWADFVFIDAGHSYHAASTDIATWLPKVREGGWFGGHDYHLKFPGVIRAVHDRFGEDVEILAGHIWARA